MTMSTSHRRDRLVLAAGGGRPKPRARDHSPHSPPRSGRRRARLSSPFSRALLQPRAAGGEGEAMEWEPTASGSEGLPWLASCPGGNGSPGPARVPPQFGRRLLRNRRPEAYIELTPDLVIVTLGFLSAAERHSAASAAVCRQHRDRVRENREVWVELCAEAPWRVARAALEGRSAMELRGLHRRVLDAAWRASHRGATVSAVSEIMAEHGGVAGVQRRCLETLAERLHCEQARKAALEARVTAQVVAALWAFAKDASLQVVALHCVVFLARPIGGAEGMVFHRGMASQGLEAFLGDDGGIAAVLASMREHGRDARVQAMGCWSLVNLALNHQQKLELLKLRGLDCVLDAMAHHPGVLEVQFRALFALINLVIPEAGARAEDDLDLKHAYRRVVLHVLDAMASFPDSEKLVRCGCLVLHNLSLDDANVPHLLAAGVCLPLQRAARHHKDADVQRSASSTLRRLGVLDVVRRTDSGDGLNALAEPDDAG